MSTGKPNIIWIVTDQHRADVLGVSTNPTVKTPHLDGLANTGVLFENMYCQGPVCVPARVSLMTERYVRDHGAFDNDYPAPNALSPTVVNTIRDAGYYTAAIGKLHLFPHTSDVVNARDRMYNVGFDETHEEVGKIASGFVHTEYTEYLSHHGLLSTYRRFVSDRSPLLRAARARDGSTRPGQPTWAVDSCPLPAEHYIDTYVGRRAAEWIRSRTCDDPFFLWVGFPGPHDPWDAPERYVRRYSTDTIPLDSTHRPAVPADGPLNVLLNTFLEYSSSSTLTDERIREVRRRYYANVTLIDEMIGEIIAAVDERGLRDNTWVIYTSDHGEMLGTHGFLSKMVFYDQSVRVPLIIRPPEHGHGTRVNGLLEHIDLSATIRTIAGAKKPEGSCGISFDGALRGVQSAARDVVVSENLGFGMWRTERYKIVVYETTAEPLQLFDLQEDPMEEWNLVDDRKYRDVRDILMHDYVYPFLASKPVRSGPDLVERQGRLGVGHPLN